MFANSPVQGSLIEMAPSLAGGQHQQIGRGDQDGL
jgi:hypothetical protein